MIDFKEKCKETFLSAIGIVHAEFPLCFELEDDCDIDSAKEDLSPEVYRLYSFLIDASLDLGATGFEIGNAYTPKE